MNQSLGDLGWCIIIFHSHLHTTLRKDADMSNVIQASSARARIQIVSQTYFWSLQAQEAVSLKDCYSKWSELHQSLSKRFLHAFCQRQIRSQAALMGSAIPHSSMVLVSARDGMERKGVGVGFSAFCKFCLGTISMLHLELCSLLMFSSPGALNSLVCKWSRLDWLSEECPSDRAWAVHRACKGLRNPCHHLSSEGQTN